ncbi:MAG: hypothetical protein WD847_10850 [Pirellulales bacterium]
MLADRADFCVGYVIRDVMRRLLAAFDIAPDQLQLFLRQDRDAAREVA